MEESLETFKALDPVEYLSKFTASNTRPSSRPHHTARPTTLLPSILTRNTHGSSLTTLGQTQVISAITLEIGTPAPSSSSECEGEINVSVSFSPLCGGQYNTSGRIIHTETSDKSSAANAYHDPQSIESFVKRTIVSSQMIDLTQLAVSSSSMGMGGSSGESSGDNDNKNNNNTVSRMRAAAWKVNVHCMVVNHDGNVIDALILGAVTALKDLRLPPIKMETNPFSSSGGSSSNNQVVRFLSIDEDDDEKECKDNDNNNRNRKGEKLTFHKMCVPLTVGFFQDKMLVDPSLEEESLCDAMLTVVIDAMSLSHGGSGVNDDDEGDVAMKSSSLTGDILNLSKSGGGALASKEEIAACVQLAFGRAEELKSILLS